MASHREERSRTLYEFARDLSGLLTTAQVIETAEDFMARAFHAKVAVLVPDARERLHSPTARGLTNPVDETAAALGVRASQARGRRHRHAAGQRVPVPAAEGADAHARRARHPARAQRAILLIPEQRQQFETFAALMAIALERVHYVEVARDALVQIESERLRNSLLSALSHDLRTPLAALLGLAETLAITKPPLSADQDEHRALDRRGGARG